MLQVSSEAGTPPPPRQPAESPRPAPAFLPPPAPPADRATPLPTGILYIPILPQSAMCSGFQELKSHLSHKQTSVQGLNGAGLERGQDSASSEVTRDTNQLEGGGVRPWSTVSKDLL